MRRNLAAGYPITNNKIFLPHKNKHECSHHLKYCQLNSVKTFVKMQPKLVRNYTTKVRKVLSVTKYHNLSHTKSKFFRINWT
jgi:hypothetical protein